ncbi:hypothetical protein ACOACQ_06185 [Nocardioides sp. CPCC 206347]|uniref:hypothetical protein n=1 Tax=unclassified Nocardioides TaxID=2615069 RepID=UPI0036154896
MTDEIEETGADRQAALQAREQEKKYADSSTAVTPDTQRADPGEALDAPFEGEESRGQSTVFSDPPKPRPSSDVDAGVDSESTNAGGKDAPA